MDSSAMYRNRCDAAFPLSDHADHGELIEHVEETGAKKVYAVHGFTEEFAGDLRYLGIDALALWGGNQLELLRHKGYGSIQFEDPSLPLPRWLRT